MHGLGDDGHDRDWKLLFVLVGRSIRAVDAAFKDVLELVELSELPQGAWGPLSRA